MKRYFQILFGGGLLSLLAVQSYGVVTIGNSGGNTTDSAYTYAHWNTTQADGGGRVLAYDRGDILRDGGNNDVFQFTVNAGLTGTLTVVDLGAPNDRYKIFNFNGGAEIGETVFGSGAGAFNNNGNLRSPNAALADDNYHRFEWDNLAPGTYDFQVSRDFGAANSGGLAFRLEAIPEPSVSLLAMFGLVGLVARRRRS